ncbi:MAG: tetratricopeptide repeat protein, partial [Clostridia bacterium]
YFGTISDGAELDAAIVDRMDFQRERDWLQQVAKTTVSPLIEQKIDARLVFEKGDLEAAKRLHESGEKLGYSIPLNGTVEKFLIRLYPDGSLSQGIKRYEAITGKAYFYAGDDEDWYQSDGTDYNQPKRGIEQWTQFLQTYPNHPAADDAAYRLSRCYQLIGHYDQALHWYEQATVRGDRDMTFDASGQFVYVIDVEMGQADFAKLLKDQKLPEWKKVWFRYTKAVDLIRSTQYKQAADELARLIEDADGKNVFEQSIWNGNVMYGMDEYDAFWDRVKEQLNHTRKLADLQDSIHSLTGQTKAQKQYELAAAIYHNEMTYYNYLWRGERQSFFWLGQIKTMEYNEKLDHYIGSFNHLIQASHVFSGINLDEAGGDLAAKTLYSLALCYSKLTEYGMEVGFHLTDTQLVERIVQTGENLLKRVPQSDLADDMLMLMFNHTQQAEYLERLIKGYPTADQASKAKKLLEEMMNQSAEQANEWKQDTACVSRLPYQTIFPDDSRVTPAVKAWTDKHRGSYYQGSMKEEEWTYFFLSNTEGKKVELGGIEVNHKKNYVYFYAGLVTDNEKRFRKRPDVLVRVPTRFLATGETKFQLSN